MAYLHGAASAATSRSTRWRFPPSWPSSRSIIRHVTDAGVDAVLVQDLGLVRLIRAVCPDLPIHASTQMTLTSAECIAWREQLGIERVVLARELSIDEIRTDPPRRPRCRWRCSSTARCAWPTPASA